MKIITFTVLAALMSPRLFSEEGYASSTLESFSVEQAESALERVKGSRIGEDLASAAISSRRMDLIQVCLNDVEAVYPLLDLLRQLQDLDFKDRAVLMVLKSESPFWAEDDAVGGLSGRNFMREPFRDTIQRNLPDLPMGDHLVETRAARVKLARSLEVALGRKDGTMPPPQKERAERRPDKEGDRPGEVGGRRKGVAASGGAGISGTTAAPAGGGYWLAGVAAVLTAGGILWHFFRKRRR